MRTGETYDEKTGRYRFSRYGRIWKGVFNYILGTLTRNDAVPAGKKQKGGDSLREKEDRFIADKLNAIDTQGGNMRRSGLNAPICENQIAGSPGNYKEWLSDMLKLAEEDRFCKKKIRTITEDEAILWVDELHAKEGKGYSSLHTLKGVLRQAFIMAKKNRWVVDNPFTFSLNKKRYGGVQQRDAGFKSRYAEVLGFRKTDRHFQKYFNGIFILFNTGLRISEFCGPDSRGY